MESTYFSAQVPQGPPVQGAVPINRQIPARSVERLMNAFQQQPLSEQTQMLRNVIRVLAHEGREDERAEIEASLRPFLSNVTPITTEAMSYESLENALENAFESASIADQGGAPGVDPRLIPPSPQRMQAQAVNAAAVEDARFLSYNPYSFFWSKQAIHEHPFLSISCGILLWPLGMLGYALSLPVRTTLFVISIMGTFVALFKACVGKTRPGDFTAKQRLLSIAGTTGELVSGILGCALPPLAYKMDEWIQDNENIHNYYKSFFLSMSLWNIETETIVGDAVQRIVARGNEERVALKKGRLKDLIPYFKESKALLEKYLMKDMLVMNENLNVFLRIGLFLIIMSEKHDLSPLLKMASENLKLDPLKVENGDDPDKVIKKVEEYKKRLEDFEKQKKGELEFLCDALGYELEGEKFVKKSDGSVGSIKKSLEKLSQTYTPEKLIDLFTISQIPEDEDFSIKDTYLHGEETKEEMELELTFMDISEFKDVATRIRNLKGLLSDLQKEEMELESKFIDGSEVKEIVKKISGLQALLSDLQKEEMELELKVTSDGGQVKEIVTRIRELRGLYSDLQKEEMELESKLIDGREVKETVKRIKELKGFYSDLQKEEMELALKFVDVSEVKEVKKIVKRIRELKGLLSNLQKEEMELELSDIKKEDLEITKKTLNQIEIKIEPQLKDLEKKREERKADLERDKENRVKKEDIEKIKIIGHDLQRLDQILQRDREAAYTVIMDEAFEVKKTNIRSRG